MPAATEHCGVRRGAGVGKPPREETAGSRIEAVRLALWGFDRRGRSERVEGRRLREAIGGDAADNGEIFCAAPVP